MVDAFGNPNDDQLELSLNEKWPINGKPTNPMKKSPIREKLDVGIKVINSLFTVGRGQRLGIIAGSGGKSSLGMMTKFTEADVVIVGLIGERGRELGNFVSEVLNDSKRTTIVAVPADNLLYSELKVQKGLPQLPNFLDQREKMSYL